mmetsp:Transcript_37970/g.98013  ORF Transcript_37970/g.98013 Transcript_37970/m.98013 type:complete len:392 (+) Transcript_37970:851-2026(+)
MIPKVIDKSEADVVCVVFSNELSTLFGNAKTPTFSSCYTTTGHLHCEDEEEHHTYSASPPCKGHRCRYAIVCEVGLDILDNEKDHVQLEHSPVEPPKVVTILRLFALRPPYQIPLGDLMKPVEHPRQGERKNGGIFQFVRVPRHITRCHAHFKSDNFKFALCYSIQTRHDIVWLRLNEAADARPPLFPVCYVHDTSLCIQPGEKHDAKRGENVDKIVIFECILVNFRAKSVKRIACTFIALFNFLFLHITLLLAHIHLCRLSRPCRGAGCDLPIHSINYYRSNGGCGGGGRNHLHLAGRLLIHNRLPVDLHHCHALLFIPTLTTTTSSSAAFTSTSTCVVHFAQLDITSTHVSTTSACTPSYQHSHLKVFHLSPGHVRVTNIIKVRRGVPT